MNRPGLRAAAPGGREATTAGPPSGGGEGRPRGRARRGGRAIRGLPLLLVALLLPPLLLPAPARAQAMAAPDLADGGGRGADNAAPARRLLVVPYPFTSETIGPGLGVGIVGEGYLQPGAGTVWTALVGSGSYLVFMKALNFRLPGTGDRVLLEPDFEVGKYGDVKTFTGEGNPGFPGERAGSNGSDRDDYVESDVKDYWANLVTKVVLPIGQGRDAPLPRVARDRGLAVSGDTGGDAWSPLSSGRTYLEAIPFLRRQSLLDNGTHTKTAGVEVALRYDNTDWRANPTKGSMQRLWVTRDWGAADSTSPYTVVGADFMKYIPLGPGKYARERVVALDAWTVNCPTWDDGNRPPAYKGGSLGGLSRLRAYPATRFNDQAAVLYTGEYRYLLDWNPLRNLTLGGRLQVDWFEVVGFGELGRVAPAWSPGELHRSMKYDGGLGLRAMANNIVVRLDVAAGTEGWASQLFVGHPFPFN